MTKKTILGAVAALAVALSPGPGGAQSVATRTPNLTGGWTAPPGVIQFNFLHRFSMSDPPLRKVTNTPTFMVGTGITEGLMVGFTYGSNSALVPAFPNEWELYARAMLLSEARGRPLDVSAQAGYNVASESVDGELLVARGFGPLKLLAAGRAFSEAYDGSEVRYAVTGGAALRLTPSVSLAADYGVLLDRADDERAAWGVGLQLGVPFTPHSFSIHATNVGTASLEGVSRGTRTRWGFEYTVPITLERFLPRGGRDDDGEADEMPGADMMATGDTVVIDIQGIQYTSEAVTVDPGTTVIWVNRDPIQHSVTANDESFDSGLIDPEQSFAMTFDTPGTYAYHCTPHPFMEARVVVRDMMEGMP
jgi:plastocyanin